MATLRNLLVVVGIIGCAPGQGAPDGGGGLDAPGGDDDADAGADAGAVVDIVLPEDTVLVPPGTSGPVLATIVGYEMSSHCPFEDLSQCELPLYSSYDRNDAAFWDILVDELLLSRVDVVMAHGRGCLDPGQGDEGNGNMCPRLLRHLIEAIDRADARDVLRLAMFDDTGAYPGTRNIVDGLPFETPFDLADPSAWRFFWDHNMRVWFDTVPQELWYRLDGRPVIAFWTLADAYFSNQQGNARALLADLRAKFQARYGEDPTFLVDHTWIGEDTSLTPADVEGANRWFDPPSSNHSYHLWGGRQWGAMVPAYRNPGTDPGCGVPCREITRGNGAVLDGALAAGTAMNARLTLLEGWTNVVESAGFYRSDAWAYPNQYINIVRRHADPSPPTLRFQAEAADAYSDGAPENIGGQYRGGGLDIGALPGDGGWFVGWTDPGEWIEFADVELGCGQYRLTARVATDAPGRSLRVELNGTPVATVPVPHTGGWESYQLLHLGQFPLAEGAHDLRVVFETGLVNLDWVFVRRAAACGG